MKNLFIPFLAILPFLLLSCRTGQAIEPAATPVTMIGNKEAFEDGDMESLFQQAEQAQNQKDAIDLYCEAARLGHPLSQFRLGQIFTGDTGHGLLEKKSAQPQPEKQPAAKRNLAAAMMWLDMAIINKVPEARDLREKLGLLAKPADFNLYADYTRMEVDAPCAWDEIYNNEPLAAPPRPEEQSPAGEYYDVKDGEDIE